MRLVRIFCDCWAAVSFKPRLLSRVGQVPLQCPKKPAKAGDPGQKQKHLQSGFDCSSKLKARNLFFGAFFLNVRTLAFCQVMGFHSTTKS